jgi:hypothetical protein
MGKTTRTQYYYFSILNLGPWKELGLWDGFRMGKTALPRSQNSFQNAQKNSFGTRKSEKRAKNSFKTRKKTLSLRAKVKNAQKNSFKTRKKTLSERAKVSKRAKNLS